MSDDELAEKLLRVMTAEMQYKADCFDYLCWLNETEQSENVKGAKFLVMASDGTTCWGDTYSDAVKVAMQHDKELYDAVQDLLQTEKEPNK
jgi:serine/threonine protein phosphatase PrpC